MWHEISLMLATFTLSTMCRRHAALRAYVAGLELLKNSPARVALRRNWWRNPGIKQHHHWDQATPPSSVWSLGFASQGKHYLLLDPLFHFSSSESQRPNSDTKTTEDGQLAQRAAAACVCGTWPPLPSARHRPSVPVVWPYPQLLFVRILFLLSK